MSSFFVLTLEYKGYKMGNNIAITISADTEWKAVKSIYQKKNVDLFHTPFGERFVTEINNNKIDIFFGGWGKISAAASTQYIIDNFKPELIINLGTCGGFASHTKSKELILVNETLSYDIYEEMFDSETAINHFKTIINTEWLNISDFRRGIIVSGDRDISPSDIDTLHSKYNAIAGDWESAAISYIAKINNTKVIIIRGVSDIINNSHGEAYLDSNIFVNNTRIIMNKLFNYLPEIIKQYHQ